MRNPNRIPVILRKIEAMWKANPDLRLGQFIANVIDPRYLYEVSDTVLIDLIEQLYDNVETETTELEPENHKGEFCIYNKNTFCQEGICSECEIHKVTIC